MKKLTIILILLFCCYNLNSLLAQDFEGLKYGTDSTFDIGSWNLKEFPTNKDNTLIHLTKILKKIDLDVIAIQEIKDSLKFIELAELNPEYKAYWKINYILGLGFLVKKNIEVIEIKEIFNFPKYWSIFPRAPLILEIIENGNKIIIINNHLKCCGDGILDTNDSKDEETTRINAIKLLKKYVDENYQNEKVILLGDFNDNLSDDPQNNIFGEILNDNNYTILDYNIAFKDSTYWSYPSWPDHIDHIIINNNLESEFNLLNKNSINEAVKVLKIDDYYQNGLFDYFKNISDHRPIVAKFDLSNKTSIKLDSDNKLTIYPNPTYSNDIKVNITGIEYANITIIDILGYQILQLPNFENNSNLDISSLDNGIYLIQVQTNNKTYSQKLIVNR